MKYGINTLLWTAGFDESHLAMLPRFREWGFDGVEVARFEFDSFPAAAVRRAAEAADLKTVFCSALTGDLSIVSEDSGVRQRALAYLRRGIEVAAEIGADTFVGPYCAPVGYLPGRRRTEDEWKRAVEGLQSLGPVLDSNGVTIALEPLNRFETYFLNTTADAVSLCRQVGHPHVGILFDTFHANIEEKNIGAALESCGPLVKHIHTCENDRGIPGSGHVEWRDIFNAARAIDYDRWVVIESFGARIPEIAAAACIWRDLAPSSDSIAADGLKFLKATAGISAAA
jgi:D-psicose/D-tagatose/L-ribulose 3-epimerase